MSLSSVEEHPIRSYIFHLFLSLCSILMVFTLSLYRTKVLNSMSEWGRDVSLSNLFNSVVTKLLNYKICSVLLLLRLDSEKGSTKMKGQTLCFIYVHSHICKDNIKTEGKVVRKFRKNVWKPHRRAAAYKCQIRAYGRALFFDGNILKPVDVYDDDDEYSFLKDSGVVWISITKS